MRIKIIKCSDNSWYADQIGKEYNVIRELEDGEYERYGYANGDYVIRDNFNIDTGIRHHILEIVDKRDAEVIFSGVESTRHEPASSFKEEIIPIVNHPSHYNKGKIEVIDFIEDQELGFNLGNAVKYISRAGKKNVETYIQDLKKAIWYLEREVYK